MAAAKNTPKDVQVMASILKEVGVPDFEPRVLNHMLELTYRYVTDVLDDARVYSSHAKKKSVDTDDVKLAINLVQEKKLTPPPSRELLDEVSRIRNGLALPAIRSTSCLRLPHDRYSLVSCNYRLKSKPKKTKTIHTVSRTNVTSFTAPSGTKSFNAMNLNKTISTMPGVIQSSGIPPLQAIPRPTLSISKPAMSRPMVEFLDGNKPGSPALISSIPTAAEMPKTNLVQTTQMLIPTVNAINSDMQRNMEALTIKNEQQMQHSDIG